jgi:hypothetical protein
VDAAIAGLVDAEADILADLSPADRRQLADLLRTLSISLGD